jgi:hypothetical protein
MDDNQWNTHVFLEKSHHFGHSLPFLFSRYMVKMRKQCKAIAYKADTFGCDGRDPEPLTDKMVQDALQYMLDKKKYPELAKKAREIMD